MSEQEPCGLCCDPSSAWLGITAPTAANGNVAPSSSQPGRALFPSHPRPHRKALKKARSDTKAATPTQCMGYSALTRGRECLDHVQGDNSQHSHPENLGKSFFEKAKKYPEIGYFTPVFYPQRISDLKVVTKISTAGKTLEKTKLLPKVIRISCSDGTSCQMFSSAAVRKSVTIKQFPASGKRESCAAGAAIGPGKGQLTLQNFCSRVSTCVETNRKGKLGAC